MHPSQFLLHITQIKLNGSNIFTELTPMAFQSISHNAHTFVRLLCHQRLSKLGNARQVTCVM